jgi:hypothetical protein
MAASRRQAAPLPLAQSFVICREILEDCRSHEFVLIGPLSALRATDFPVAVRWSIYANLTCGHGDYELALRLHDTEDRLLWEWLSPEPITLATPLEQHEFTLYDAILEFPEPGRYDLLLLANGEELSRHALHVVTVSGL